MSLITEIDYGTPASRSENTVTPTIDGVWRHVSDGVDDRPTRRKSSLRRPTRHFWLNAESNLCGRRDWRADD